MPPKLDKESTLRQAKEEENEYNWLNAAKHYEKVAKREPEATASAAPIWERIGFCYDRASKQAECVEEFKKTRRLAVEAYMTAAQLFGKDKDGRHRGKGAQCEALAAYLRSWLASDPSEKREALDECCKMCRESLNAYEEAKSNLDYGRVCNDLLLCLLERLYVSPDAEEMKRIAKDGIEWGGKAVAVLSKLDDNDELVRAYALASLQAWYAANISEQEEMGKELARKSLEYSEEALKLCKVVNNPYWVAMANWAASFCTVLFTEKVDVSRDHAEEILKQANIARDNYLKGVASYVLAFVTNWMVLREADPDKKRQEYVDIFKYAEDAVHSLELVSQDFFIAETCLFYADSYSSQARDFQISLTEKKTTLEKAVAIGRQGLEHATRSGSPDAIGSTLHALSKALHFYSNLESGRIEKTRLLEEALAHRERYNEIVERAFPSNQRIRGVGENYQGLIKADLARLKADKLEKRTLLESAASDMEAGVSRCRKWISSYPVPTVIAVVGTFEDGLGGVLNELYSLTKDGEFLAKAVEAFKSASGEFSKANLPSRSAESYWKMAKDQDLLGEHQEAAENFAGAKSQYEASAQKIPSFKTFYLDHATYMEAWSDIEKAKTAHEREEYATAKDHYERASKLLESSKLWNYLSPNFLAWSLLEQAEDLSRKGSGTESTEIFRKTAGLFGQTKETFEKNIDKIQNQDEREKALELCKASARRKEYCLARINVEEARRLDQMAEYARSAEEYGLAVSGFEKLLNAVETEAERRELNPIVQMCRAWQKMKVADAQVSPELYDEASELFLKVREHTLRNRTILLASGNGAFCKALEYGTRFEATRNEEDFSKAKTYLGSAANYYLKAGFDDASSWTTATEVLFDAYNYMIRAEIEHEPQRKMNACLLAEKCLERSAKLYETAGYVGKKDEVIRILQKVKEKREFALSLGELVAAPGEASSTSAISAPSPTVEEPVGLLKFENEVIEANLIARQTELVVGENFGLEVQLVNLGKKTAFLIRVDDIIPEGFDLVEKPERCLVNDGFLNLKGRKLPPLETEQMSVKLKARKKGKFVFTPRIQFTDEAGEQKSLILEQVTLTVKELGIRGWLKGQD